MTNDGVEAKALALVNEVLGEWGKDVRYSSLGRLGNSTSEALFRAVEQHEAFKQEVSDAVESALLDAEDGATIRNNLGHFIIPKPKPDPLVEAIEELNWLDPELSAKHLRAVLEARGLEIREKGQ
jgi:hypothetical protein